MIFERGKARKIFDGMVSGVAHHRIGLYYSQLGFFLGMDTLDEPNRSPHRHFDSTMLKALSNIGKAMAGGDPFPWWIFTEERKKRINVRCPKLIFLNSIW